MDKTIRVRAYATPQYGCLYSEELAFAQLAEHSGFDAYFRSDHYAPISDVDFAPGATDAWVSLAAISRETSRLRLGTLMSCALFRLPGVLAVMAAQIDEMSSGRIELGLGGGWNQDECLAYGIPFPDQQHRLGALDEQLEIILGMWNTPAGQRFSFEGDHYQLRNCPALPKPRQHPRPPVVLGVTGPRRAAIRVARFGDEANVAQASPADVAAAIARVRRACDDVDRDPETIRYSVLTQVVCGQNASEVAQRIESTGVTERTLRERHSVIGSPAEVSEALAKYVAVGVDTIYLHFHDLHDLDHLAFVAETVFPVVTRWSAS